jgi:tRNA G18 (ribose-2'-O)-methylase SpoU
VLVIGAEGGGLPAGAYRYLDRRLTIPMQAPVDSLNAAVAAALLLYSTRIARPGSDVSDRRVD